MNFGFVNDQSVSASCWDAGRNRQQASLLLVGPSPLPQGTCYIQGMNFAPDDPQLAAAATALTAEADLPAELEGQPGTFRLALKIWAVITPLAILAAFVGGEAAVLGIIIAIVGGLCVLVLGITDLTVPKARDRSSSEQAVNAYFKGMQKGRWDTAFAALSPYAREREVAVPRILKLHTLSWAGARSSKKELKKYWRSIIQAHGGMSRRLAKIKLTPIGIASQTHSYRVELHIQHYPSWVIVGIFGGVLPLLILILITRRTYKTTFDVRTVKHKSQWWVLDGEFKAPMELPDTGLPKARVV